MQEGIELALGIFYEKPIKFAERLPRLSGSLVL